MHKETNIFILTLMAHTYEKSRELFARAERCVAGGVNSGIRKLEKPVPLYFERGRGCRLWDADGNESIDFQNGQGALLFGHAPEGLAEAIGAQARLGTHWAAQSQLEIEVAERLQAMIPCAELTRFNNSATEAVNSVFRLVRAHTGRPMILKFEGHYHGWGDEGLVGFGATEDRWGSEENPSNAHPSQGIIPEVPGHFAVVQWNDPEHLRRRVKEFAGRIAAIVFEPVLCNTCCIEPVEGMLKTIRELCDEHGIVMIADETITGFRFGPAGAQGYFGVDADIMIYGKAVGGGVPFAGFSGRRRFFEKILNGQVVHAGTLNSNPLCLAASKWCLDKILHCGNSHPSELNRIGCSMMEGLRLLADRHGIPLRPQGPGLVFHTVMLKAGAAEGPILNHRDYVRRHDAKRFAHLRQCLLEEGVRAIERGLWFVGFEHREADIQEALQRVDVAFSRHAEASH